MFEKPMRVFESRRSGARVRVEVNAVGMTTYFRGCAGKTRPWGEMRPTLGAKPEWSYEEEIGVLEGARWEEK